MLVANYANLALLAERWLGVARGVDNVVVVFGTEELIGTAIMDSGHALTGRSGGAGEIYWVSTLDGHIGIPRLAADLARRASTTDYEWPQSVLTKYVPERITADIVLDACDAGDQCARHIAYYIAASQAAKIRTISIMLNPELVLLAGFAPRWREAITEHAAELLAHEVQNPLRVMSSPLGELVVAVGALRLAFEYLHNAALDNQLLPVQPRLSTGGMP